MCNDFLNGPLIVQSEHQRSCLISLWLKKTRQIWNLQKRRATISSTGNLMIHGHDITEIMYQGKFIYNIPYTTEMDLKK